MAMDWFSPREPVFVDSEIESIMSIVFAYYRYIGQTPGYTEVDVMYYQISHR